MIKLEIDINTMEAKDWIKWDDNQRIVTGVSHSQTHSDGSMISVGMTMTNSMKLELLVYRMEPNDHKNRKVIAAIPMDEFYFLHSFALTENYAVIYIPPVYYKNMMTGMIAGKMILDMFTQDMDGTTKMIVVDLKTGQFKTIDTNEWLFTVHFGQSYETSNGDIIIEVPTLNTASAFVDLFLRENYNKIEKMTIKARDSALSRFTVNYEQGTVQRKALTSVNYGMIDLPQLNWNVVGKKEVAQYTYMTHVLAGEKFN